MSSSKTSTPEEDRGCVEGVLVEIEQEERERVEVLEFCLADDKGEEHDLIAWDEVINVGKKCVNEPVKESGIRQHSQKR